MNGSFRECVSYISRAKVSPVEIIKFMVQIQNAAGYHHKKATTSTKLPFKFE